MENINQKKIVITGGHITPAMAVIDEILATHKDWRVVLLGRTSAQEGRKGDSPEPALAQEKGISFYAITTGRLKRTLSAAAIFSLLKVPVGFFQALRYCASEKPDCIVSFGGYIALPVVLAGACTGIPILTHEQTSVSGLANRIIARFARRVMVTFEHTAGSFPPDKTVWTGLPLRKELFVPARKPRSIPGILPKPLIYITGGSAGAVSLNTIIFSIIPKLSRHFFVVHQTGSASYDKALELKRRLPAKCSTNYVVSPYIAASDVAWIFQHAALVVGRAGANTVVELAALQVPAVLIPLPWSGGGEQEKNALWLAKTADAVVIYQDKAMPDTLLSEIEHIVGRRQKASRTRYIDTIHKHAAGRVVGEIAAVIE